MLKYKFKLKAAKGLFFDRRAVRNLIDDRTHKILSRYGYFVMKDARQSIRRRKRVSKPDQSPTDQTGVLKRTILFYYDPKERTVVIGPVGDASSTIPAALEYGGYTVNSNGGRKQRIDGRPFMNPANERQRKKLPTLIANSVR